MDCLINDNDYSRLLTLGFIKFVLLFAIALSLLALFLPSKKRECDIMADIGYVMYVIIICVFFKVSDIQDSQKVIEHFIKDGTYIEQALINIQKDYKNEDSYFLINNVCADESMCFAKYIPSTLKYNKLKNVLMTTDNKSYIFSIKEHCKNPYNDQNLSSDICYIDVKDTKLKKFMRVYLSRIEYRKELNLPPGKYRIFSKELRKNYKRIRHIG